MSDLRERKPAEKAAPAAPEAEDTKKSQQPKTAAPDVDLEPNIWVLTIVFILFSTVVGTFLYYKIDNASEGDFASWVNYRFPRIEKLLNQPGKWPGFGANAEEIPVPAGLKLTEAELKAFDGSDPEQPIYLALNGTIYDVSASPSFYGPGGHYHHFVGKDATRAWVTECWDDEDQFTWRLDNLEELFAPQYLDEQLESVVQGQWDPSLAGGLKMPKEAMMMLAKKSMERFGSVTDGEKARRRAEDKEEADKAVAAVIEKWTKFFAGSDKYATVGSVIYDQDKPAPPAFCKKALEKKPIKGGKLEGLMGNLSKMGQNAPQEGEEDGEEDNFPEGMPEHVKAQIKKDRAAKKAAASVEDVDLTKDGEEDAAEAVRDEL